MKAIKGVFILDLGYFIQTSFINLITLSFVWYQIIEILKKTKEFKTGIISQIIIKRNIWGRIISLLFVIASITFIIFNLLKTTFWEIHRISFIIIYLSMGLWWSLGAVKMPIISSHGLYYYGKIFVWDKIHEVEGKDNYIKLKVVGIFTWYKIKISLDSNIEEAKEIINSYLLKKKAT